MKRTLLRWCLLAAFVPATVLAADGQATPGVGSHAPPLDLIDLSGTARKVSWGEGTPAVTVVFFFDAQAAGCLLEMSYLDALFSRGRDFGLAVYGVEARGRQPAEVNRSLERYCLVYRDPSFPILPDPSYRAGRTFGADQVPMTFIMESHGVVLDKIVGYGPGDAVRIARRVEQLLKRERGFFSPVLRETGVSEAEEREAEARIAAAAARSSAPPARAALGVGDRAPAIEFADTAGTAGRWDWSDAPARVMRVVAFFGGLSIDTIAELSWLDTLARRGRESGLEALGVEVGGMSGADLQAALQRYRRYNPEPSFPVVPDPGGRIAQAFGPWDALPQTYLLAADGAIVYHAEGFSVGESEIMTGKVERAFLLAGRPLPALRSGGAADAPGPVEEEAPSIRRKQDLDDRYQSAIVKADAAFVSWEFDRALPFYLTALEVQPRDLHALVRAAQIHERRGEPGPALELWERVLGVRPDHPEAASRVKELRRPR